MTREEFNRMKPDILEVLASKPPLDPQELIEILSEKLHLDIPESRHATWRLIDDGDIRLSLDRKFELAKTPVL